ncbi:MAG: OmpA family protein [Rhodobiaceae bacterium]|nr:OmpA family protein [Rhodobiaceae bacterium]
MKLRNWLVPGLASILIATAAAMLIRGGHIETDIAGRGATVLHDGEFGWASIAVDGRDVTLTGTAPTPEAQSGAVAALDRIPGVRAVDDRTDLLPIQSPYEISLTKDQGRITISGSFPTQKIRGETLAIIRSANSGATVEDETALARGAPEAFGMMMAFAAERLGELQSGAIAYSGSAMTISGRTANLDDYAAVSVALTEGLPQGVTLAERDLAVPIVSPYTWMAEMTQDGLVLSGYIPSADMRPAILAAAQREARGRPVFDRMMEAFGAPQGVAIDEVAEYLLKRVGRMATGLGELTDATVSISGVADTPEDYAVIAEIIGAYAPAGVHIERADILPPEANPYVWAASRSEDGVVLAGHIPNDAMRDDIIAIAKATAGTPIEDRMSVARGAPRGFIGAVKAALGVLPQLGTGRVAMTGTTFEVSGEDLPEDKREAAAAALARALPPGFDSPLETAAITPTSSAPAVQPANDGLTMPECEANLSSVVSSGHISFAPGRATISDDSFAVLDELARVFRRCPAARFEVGGHTDSDGSAEANQSLSEDRANAVRDYLVAAGVSPERLVARGYGEEQPIVSNDTPDGKARNRRIEFSLLAGG